MNTPTKKVTISFTAEGDGLTEDQKYFITETMRCDVENGLNNPYTRCPLLNEGGNIGILRTSGMFDAYIPTFEKKVEMINRDEFKLTYHCTMKKTEVVVVEELKAAITTAVQQVVDKFAQATTEVSTAVLNGLRVSMDKITTACLNDPQVKAALQQLAQNQN